MATSGEAVTVLEYETQTYRPTRISDLYDAARLADQLEHIHNFGQPFIAAELSGDVYKHDMNIAYASVAGTQMGMGLGVAVVDHVEPIIALFDMVLGREGAAEQDSFAQGGLDSPYYTRPVVFRGARVPDVLLSGDHGAIARWRAETAREATKKKRPDR